MNLGFSPQNHSIFYPDHHHVGSSVILTSGEITELAPAPVWETTLVEVGAYSGLQHFLELF